MDCTIVVGFRPEKGTTMTPVPPEMDRRTLWKAEITADLIRHLSDEDKVQIRRDLDAAIEPVCLKYQVGKEYKHELRTTA